MARTVQINTPAVQQRQERRTVACRHEKLAEGQEKKYRLCGYIRHLFLLMILVGSLSAQQNPVAMSQSPPVEFHGRGSAFYQTADRQGTGSEIPKELWRNDLSLTLTLWGVPLSTNTFLSAEESDLRQPMNNFRFSIDFQEIARRRLEQFARSRMSGMTNMPGAPGMPELGRDGLPKPTGFMKFLTMFKALEIGRTRPNYDQLNLRGQALTGGNVELETGIIYAAFANGRSVREIQATENADPVFRRDLLFAKAGLGPSDRSHIHLSYLHGKDDPGGIDTALADSIYLYPAENTVAGAQLGLSLFEQALKLSGEGAYSLRTRNINGMAGGINIPSQVDPYVDANFTSSADYAWMAQTELNVDNTRLVGGVDYIGSGFTTFGNPNLITDVLRYHGRINQRFFQSRVPVSLNYRRSSDNLAGWKEATTVTTSYGITAGIRPRNLPYIQAGFSPNIQVYDMDSTQIRNESNNLNLSSGYSYRIGDLALSTNSSYFYQWSKNDSDTLSSMTRTIALDQTLGFRFPLNLSAGGSYSLTEYPDDTLHILTLRGQAGYRAFDVWQNRVGLTYSRDKDNSTNVGLQYRTSVDLWTYAELGLNIERNTLTHDSAAEAVDDYTELIAKLTVSVKW